MEGVSGGIPLEKGSGTYQGSPVAGLPLFPSWSGHSLSRKSE